MEEAPDAVRDRFAAWRKAKAQPGMTDQAQFALAMSGYVAGHELAARELKAAETLWKARDEMRDYLALELPQAGSEPVAALSTLDWSVVAGGSDMIHRLEVMTRIVQLMPPPRQDDATLEKTDAASRRRGRRQRAHRVCRAASPGVSPAPELSGDRRSAFGPGAPGRARRVVRRSGTPGVYLDRAGIQP